MVHLTTVESTNTYAAAWLKQNKVEEGSVVYSFNQTNGRGQRGNVWLSEPNSNVAFSLVLFPSFLAPDESFYLSKIISLGVCDLMAGILEDVTIKIKWPNDIYINGRKIAGILIENSINENSIKSSIIGIGINVNQQFFSNEINATSFRILTQKVVKLEYIVTQLCSCIEARYLQLKAGKTKLLDEQYTHKLYQLNETKKYSSSNGVFEGRVSGVSKQGKLQIKTNAEQIQEFSIKEIKFL